MYKKPYKKLSKNTQKSSQPQKSNTISKSKMKSKAKCYKCGCRLGHYAKNCKVKEKINNLNLAMSLKKG